MAFTRIYVGAHHPLDVLAGLLLGGAVAGRGYPVITKVLRRYLIEPLAALRVAWLVTSVPKGTAEPVAT